MGRLNLDEYESISLYNCLVAIDDKTDNRFRYKIVGGDTNWKELRNRLILENRLNGINSIVLDYLDFNGDTSDITYDFIFNINIDIKTSNKLTIALMKFDFGEEKDYLRPDSIVVLFNKVNNVSKLVGFTSVPNQWELEFDIEENEVSSEIFTNDGSNNLEISVILGDNSAKFDIVAYRQKYNMSFYKKGDDYIDKGYKQLTNLNIHTYREGEHPAIELILYRIRKLFNIRFKDEKWCADRVEFYGI